MLETISLSDERTPRHGENFAGRIGYLVSRYPALSHTFILREVRELRRLGFVVQVASVNPADRPGVELTEEERNEAQTTFCIKEAGARGALSSHLAMLFRTPWAYVRALSYALALGGGDLPQTARHFFYLTEAVMVAQWMRTNGLQHLHAHFGTPASTVGMLTSRLIPVNFSMTIHGPDEFDEVARYRLRQKIVACKFVCTISSFTRSQLLRLSDVSQWAKISVTPLGVDTALFHPGSRGDNFEAERQTREFEILCVGRLVPAKGQRVLVAAVGRLLQTGRRIHLVLAGDGPDKELLKQCVREGGLGATVEFAGAVNQDRIRDLYWRADVFALASFAEGVPVVLMEAMATAIPCVSTWVAGIPELIRDGVDGLLVAPSDETALADALARIMDDGELRLRLGRAGRKRVVEKYDLHRNVTRLAQVFDQGMRVAA